MTLRQVGHGWSVELGDGCYDSFLNSEILWVARRLYKVSCSISPEEVFQRVMSGENICSLDHDSLSVVGGEAHDWRLLTARVSNISVDLLQYVCCLGVESQSVGFDKATFIFKDRDLAEKAKRLDQSRKASSSDVMRCLSRSMDTPFVKDLLWVGHKHEICFHKIESLDNDLVCLPSSRAIVLFQSQQRSGEITKVWVFVRERRVAALLTLVHDHWRPLSFGVLRHSLHDSVYLRWIPTALSGGIVELSLQGDDFGWPWWIDRDTKIVDDVVQGRLPPLQLPNAKRSCSVPFDTSSLSKSQIKVIENWTRSTKARGMNTWKLIGLRTATEEGRLFANGRFISIRRREDELRSYIQPTLEDNFGKKYANIAVENALKNEKSVAFEIQDVVSGKTAAVVILLLFDAVTPDGRESVAVLIDSFAVNTQHHGRGIGGVVFHDWCRFLAEQSTSADSYFVFAQCLKKGEAATFWKEKLDATSEGRNVMLQAFELGMVDVQTERDCEARARTYHVQT